MEGDDRFVERCVMYSVEHGGRIIIVEDVPARVDSETGEQFFSRETVERLQSIAWSGRLPERVQYATALVEIAAEHESEITARLNRVYGDAADGLGAGLKHAQQRSIGPEHW
jgi:hypothetical protein